MRVVVTFHDDCRADLRAWVVRLPGSPEDRRALLDIGMDEMKDMLARTGGLPPTTTFHDTPPPPSYWWRYTTECWVQYLVEEHRFWFRREKVVTVIRLHRNPPSESIPSSLRTR